MAGKKRIAATLFVGTTVLATGGGVYYGLAQGWKLPAFAWLKKEPAEATANLDAVASAWAEPTKAEKAATTDSSPVARSAKSDALAPETKSSPSPTGDRYALAAQPEVEVPAKKAEAVDESSKPANVAKSETTSAAAPLATNDTNANSNLSPEPQPTQVAEVQPAAEPATAESRAERAKPANKSKPVAEESTSVAGAATEDGPVARGQEPIDDASAKLSGGATDVGSAIDSLTSKNPAEPKPLVPPATASGLVDPSRRAKEAFGKATPPAGSDRYVANPQAGNAGSLAGGGTVQNPFPTKPGGSVAPSAASDTIQPLPPMTDEGGSQFASPPQPQGGAPLRSLRSENPASAYNRETGRAALGSTSPRGDIPNPYDRSAPMSDRSNHSNDNVSAPSAGEGTGKPGEKALEGPQQATLVIQKFAPGEIQVGKAAKFVVQIRNVGAHSADEVIVRDEMPQGTKLISTSPNATTEGSHIVWQIGKLSPGEDRTVEMQIMPISEGEIGSVATVSYTAQASVKTKCTMPQIAIRMTAPSEVMVGNQQHVKIEIKNPGSGDATGVMLFENIPPNVKHVAGPALEFEIGTLRSGETRELDLVLTAEKPGKVVNTITAKAEGNLQVQQQVEFEVIAPALSVNVNGPERRYLERPATYEVSVENPGTAAAHNVQIVTKLPKGMRFVRANNMGEYDAATHAVYWSLAELPKGERGSVELVTMPTEAGAQTLQVEGHAQQGLTDQKQRNVVVEGLAAIMFEVKDLEDPIEVGGETGYEIRVVNQGTKAAAKVQVSVELPPGLKIISADGESAHRIQDGRLLFEPLEQLAPKADTVYRIRAQGLQPGDQRITVQVNTADLEQPIRREESTRVFGDQ